MAVEVVPYDRRYRAAFIELNLAWIEKHFRVEPHDEEVLYGVDDIASAGAGVYLALDDGVPISTCMVMDLGGGEWELCKLCTAEGHRRRGAGTAVMRACIAYAREHGASFITIASNRILHDALRMYAREGFREVPVTGPMYDRVDIQLRLDL